MTQIDCPDKYTIIEFDGVDVSTIYVNGFMDLKKVNDKLSWREDKECSEMCYKPYNILTLSEITSQIKNLYGGSCPIITIFIEQPLRGTILQYGNYGDSWYTIGDTSGYV